MMYLIGFVIIDVYAAISLTSEDFRPSIYISIHLDLFFLENCYFGLHSDVLFDNFIVVLFQLQCLRI